VSAATRKHPVLLLPPLVVAVSTVIVFVLLTLVTVNPGPASTGHDQRPMGGALIPVIGGRGAGGRAGQPDRTARLTPDPAIGAVSAPAGAGTPAGFGLRASGQPSPGLQQIPPQLCFRYRQFGACSSS
jgi:hypothetical protein